LERFSSRRRRSAGCFTRHEEAVDVAAIAAGGVVQNIVGAAITPAEVQQPETRRKPVADGCGRNPKGPQRDATFYRRREKVLAVQK
jgi:hypothetical protein